MHTSFLFQGHSFGLQAFPSKCSQCALGPLFSSKRAGWNATRIPSRKAQTSLCLTAGSRRAAVKLGCWKVTPPLAARCHPDAACAREQRGNSTPGGVRPTAHFGGVGTRAAHGQEPVTVSEDAVPESQDYGVGRDSNGHAPAQEVRGDGNHSGAVEAGGADSREEGCTGTGGVEDASDAAGEGEEGAQPQEGSGERSQRGSGARELAGQAARGLQLLRSGDLETAVQALTAALEDDPTDAAVLSLRAEALLRLDRFGEALADARAALIQFPDDVYTLYRAAVAAMAVEDYSNAMAMGEALLANEAVPLGMRPSLEALVGDARGCMEQAAGRFDVPRMFSSGECPEPMAEYIGPVTVQNVGPERGRGVVVTRAVRPGELLMACKALARTTPDEPGTTPAEAAVNETGAQPGGPRAPELDQAGGAHVAALDQVAVDHRGARGEEVERAPLGNDSRTAGEVQERPMGEKDGGPPGEQDGVPRSARVMAERKDISGGKGGGGGGKEDELLAQLQEMVGQSAELGERLAWLHDGSEKELKVPTMDFFNLTPPGALPPSATPHAPFDPDKLRLIKRFNCFSTLGASIEGHEAEEDIGLWLLPAFLNHSCLPNATYMVVGWAFVVLAAVAIEPGEEVTIPYFSIGETEEERERQSVAGWRFVCQCERCHLERRLGDRIAPAVNAAREVQTQGIRHLIDFARNRDLAAAQTGLAFHRERLAVIDAALKPLEGELPEELRWMRACFLPCYLQQKVLAQALGEWGLYLEAGWRAVEALDTLRLFYGYSLETASDVLEVTLCRYGEGSPEWRKMKALMLHMVERTFGTLPSYSVQSIQELEKTSREQCVATYGEQVCLPGARFGA